MTSLKQSFIRNCLNCAIGLLLALFLCPVSAHAQVNDFGAPSIQRPTTSPYLNLFRSNNRGLNFGLNYQRLVRPEQQWRNYTSRLNSQVGTLQGRVNSAIAPDGSIILPGTGHATSFLNTGGYLQSRSGGSGAGRGAGGQIRRPPSGQAMGMFPGRR